MANVYTFNPSEPEEEFDKNNSNYQLASIAYVNVIIKKIIDIIENHINNSTAHQSNPVREKININTSESVDICELNIEIPKPSFNAKDINTDSFHRFISDDEMDNLKNKPSTDDIETAITNLRKELKLTIDYAYANLLNTPNVLQKLKNVAYVLKTDPNLDKTITDLASRITKNEFEDHVNSSLHINNDEHNNLNILDEIIKNGYADWNAPSGTPTYIKNKPNSLPANGGDADTINGYCVNDIINHQAEENIYGAEDELYPEEDANTIIKSNIDKYISMICDHGKGLFFFKTGNYTFDSMIYTMPNINNSITIKGSNNRSTIFTGNKVEFNCRVNIEDICISLASIDIKSLCTLDNMYFKNCKINFNNCNEATIRNCIFENCTIEFHGPCTNTIITGNRFIKSGRPQYYNKSNLFTNNLYY